MKYQVLQMTGCKIERIAIIEANNRAEANEQMAQMAKDRESILYLSYYNDRRPEYSRPQDSMVIATATHKGEIINY